MTEIETQSIQVNYNLSGTPCLNVRIISEEKNADYAILNYNKELLNNNKENIMLYRSVVFSHPERDLLSFSPPKMEVPGNFFVKENVSQNATYYVNEYIDGLLIHLFYDQRVNDWKLSTHNNIIQSYDGTKHHSISSVLCNVLKYNSSKDVSKLPFWDNFSKQYCYNFTLTNKYSHVHKSRKLYLTSVYELHNNSINPISPEIYEHWNMFDVLRGIIHFPENFTRAFQETSILQDEIKSLNISGMVIMNTQTGRRCKYISDAYNVYHRLRHIEPYFLYIYICYARMDKHRKILPYIYKTQYNMKKIHSIWITFVKYIHQMYIDKYVFKKDVYIQDRIDACLNEIHQLYYIYYKSRSMQSKVTKTNVLEFLLKKHPQYVLDLLQNM
jgi:hypothetical protein|uniref:Uncharacterized protein n=1 Tax=viral metagenome TaxID=1070528 RepID=A0A6C0IQ74_9ZZZZ